MNYSASLGVMITASLILLADLGHILFVVLLFPGLLVEFILTTLIPIGDRDIYSYTHYAWGANVVFYSFYIYGVSMVFHLLRSELKTEAKLAGTSVVRQASGIDSVTDWISRRSRTGWRGIIRG
jgi:hypothetical protein